MGFSGSSAGQESTGNVGDPSSIPGSGSSPGEEMATYSSILSFLDGLGGKDSACNLGDLGWEDPLEEGMATHSSILFFFFSLPYSCLENPHGQRSLVGCNPRGHKESDMTE